MLASPRSLSQRATSFIASWRQGIHRTLLSRSIHTTNARTQDQTPRCKSSATKLKTQLHSFTLLLTTPPHTQSSRPHSTAGLVTNQSDSPVKHHASRIRSPRTHHQAANPLCSGTSSSREYPRDQRHQPLSPQTLNPPDQSMETVGIEPTAPCLQSRCSTTELRPRNQRTKQPQQQATPIGRLPHAQPLNPPGVRIPRPDPPSQPGQSRIMVGQGGLEPPTPRLSSVCSNQLSYWPQRLN